MKKLLFSLALFAVIPTYARTLKNKLHELQKLQKAHAEAESKSWDFLKDLDLRISRIEKRYCKVNNLLLQQPPQKLPQKNYTGTRFQADQHKKNCSTKLTNYKKQHKKCCPCLK